MPRGCCGLPARPLGRAGLGLVTLLLLLCGSDLTTADQAGPRPPCGEAPNPAYPAPGAQPLVEVWHAEQLAGAWAEPTCISWTARDDVIVVAVAGSFHHAGDVEDFLGRFGAVSALTDIRYWSVTDQAWRSLVTAATALSAPDVARQRADFTIAEMALGQDLFFAQNDNRSSGTVVYRMRVLEVRPGRLVIETENVTAVSYWFLTLFGPGDLQAVYFLERLSQDVWGYYSLMRSAAGPTLPGVGKEASHINRGVALYRHFVGIPTDRVPPAAP